MKMVVAQWAYYQGMIKVCTCIFTYLKNYYKTSSLKLAKALRELSQGPLISTAHPSLVHVLSGHLQDKQTSCSHQPLPQQL